MSCTQVCSAIIPSDGYNVKILTFALMLPKSKLYSGQTNLIFTSGRFEGSPLRLLVGLMIVWETCFLYQTACCPSEVDIVYAAVSFQRFTFKTLKLAKHV